MLFNSYIFVFAFLPLVIAGWYLLNKIEKYNIALIYLTGMSLWFYGYFNPYYLAIIIASIVINYLISLMVGKTDKKRLLMWLGIAVNLGILFYFKYFDFFIDNINVLFKTNFSEKNILLPLGISFFTFQQISYVIDRARGKAEHSDLIKYASYVTFFPQLVAGPIVLHDELLPQFEDLSNRRFNSENFAKGLLFFSIGLAKKVILADTIAVVVNYAFSNALFLDAPTTFLAGVLYIFELYFDFSGYSDMAIGIGRMFNIFLPQNFNSPFKAYSMKDAWRRWHITLSRFFVQYVYIPLGGSRKGKIRALINVFVIFLLSGFWHGANWTFVVWGILQGIAVMWNNLYIIGVDTAEEKNKPRICIPKIIGQFITFNYFMLSFIVFRSDNLSVAKQMFKNLLEHRITGSIARLYPYADISELYIFKQFMNLKFPALSDGVSIFALILMMAISIIVITGKNAFEIVDGKQTNRRWYWFGALLLGYSIISFSQVSTFIYFNF